MVYVDDMQRRYGRMIMCHMLADTSEELHAMADRIGLDRKHCQYPDTPREHYDISLGKRRLARRLGAVEITMRGAVELIHAREARYGTRHG